MGQNSKILSSVKNVETKVDWNWDGFVVSAFSFVPASSGVADTTPSTQTNIQLAGANTFIGYGATQKESEILEITPTYLYLRAQGTETANAWYLNVVQAQ